MDNFVDIFDRCHRSLGGIAHILNLLIKCAKNKSLINQQLRDLWPSSGDVIHVRPVLHYSLVILCTSAKKIAKKDKKVLGSCMSNAGPLDALDFGHFENTQS